MAPYHFIHFPLYGLPPCTDADCALCIWLHKHNQYGRGELFYDWRSCCVFGGEIHYLVSEPSAIQYHLFIKSLFARRKWIQLQQPREREREGEGEGEREGERERERSKERERGGEMKRKNTWGARARGGGWIDDIDQAPLEIKASGLYFFKLR